MADESSQIVTENLKRVSAFVTKVESEYDGLKNEYEGLKNRVKENLVETNLNNSEKEKFLMLCISERDKAYVRLKEARADLREARKDLDKLLNPQASNQDLRELKESIANLILQEASTVYSDSKFEIVEGEEPFLSQEQQDKANRITIESELIAYLTPFFDAVLKSCNMVFVNSENYPWLPHSSNPENNLKPDGFSIHPGMYKKKDDRGATGRRYGVAEKGLFDCVVLFEGKVKLNDAAFAQVACYLKLLNSKGLGSAILFDRTSFRMITSSNGQIVKVVDAMWVNEGSKTFFQNFISHSKPSWISCLQEACDFFNVVIQESNAFLGRGAFGRVFRVFRDEEELALKIVEESSVFRLYDEVKALENAEKTNLTIKLKEGINEFSNGAAILLSPVGIPLLELRKKDVVKLFALLHQLHDQGLVHGDPRIPNVILYGDQLLWIDLVAVFDVSKHPSVHLLYKDIATLTRSILRKPPNANLGDLEILLKKYSKDASKQNLDAVVDEVCQILKYE